MKSVAGQQRERGSVLLRREVSPEKQARIARRLQRKESPPDTSGPGRSSIQKSDATEGPLSFGQQRFWFLEQLEPGQPVYNVCFGLRLNGPLDHSGVAASLGEIVRRHEALRTVFTTRDGTPVQAVMPARAVPVPVIEIEGADEEECGRTGEALRSKALGGKDEGVLRRRLEEEAAKPFDLKKDLLLRAALFRLAPEKHILLLTMHHIAADAWSIQLVLEEWTELYDAHMEGREAALPELPIQYLDFAAWQRQDQQTNQLAYWKGKLENSHGFELRSLGLNSEAALDRSGIPSNHGATRSTVLSREVSDALQQLSRGEGASIFMALLAAFKVLLYRYSGQEDIVIGSPISRRTQQQTEHLIGLFLNVAVLRTDVSGNPTFRELLRRVRTTALEAYAHQNIPFERLVEELQPARDPRRTPLFQVMFTLQDALMRRRTLGPFERDGTSRLEVEAFDFDLRVAPFDLMLLMQESEQGLVATLEYKTDLFSAEGIDRMLVDALPRR